MKEIKSYCFTLGNDSRLIKADSAFLELCGYTVGQKVSFEASFGLSSEFEGVLEHKLVTALGESLSCISFVSALNFRTVVTKISSVTESAETDLLTGLITRNELTRRESEIFDGSEELSLVFIDVDNFKYVNDNAGHSAGDKLLKRLAVLIKRIFRSDDLLCRYGGDEFVAILPGCSLKNAGIKAELLVTLAEKEGISLSAGAAAKRSGQRLCELIDNADAAMYSAKKAGKGRAAVYDGNSFGRTDV